jgi:hypothetical protein
MDVSASHNTLSLDSGTRSLSSMWSIVCDDVCDAFEDTQDLGDQVVLLEVCCVMLSYDVLYYVVLC